MAKKNGNGTVLPVHSTQTGEPLEKQPLVKLDASLWKTAD